MATTRNPLTDTLAGLSLFADVGAAHVNSIAHVMDERRFADGERILRQGITGSAFYVILEGEAAIRLDGKDYGALGRGDFFGEISILIGEPPVANITALPPLPSLILPPPALPPFILTPPPALYRMLQAEARK